ncbi:DMT family transporter [Thermoproteota archaeon]
MRNHMYMILAAVCLGTIGVLVKLIGTDVHFMTLNFYRIFIGFVFLMMVVPFMDKNCFKVTKKDIKDYIFIGVVMAIAISLYTTANLFAPIQNVVLINYMYPFLVLVLAYFYLGEKITSTKIITLILAIIGLVIINPFKFGEGNIGNLLSLLGAVFYAIMITKMRWEDRTHSISSVLWFFLFASIVLLPFPFIFGFGNLSGVWVHVLILAIVSTGLAYLFYNLALQKIEAEIGSIIAMIITPLLSIILAVLIINETLNMRILLGGGLLVIAGVYLEMHKKKSKRR